MEMGLIFFTYVKIYLWTTLPSYFTKTKVDTVEKLYDHILDRHRTVVYRTSVSVQ